MLCNHFFRQAMRKTVPMMLRIDGNISKFRRLWRKPYSAARSNFPAVKSSNLLDCADSNNFPIQSHHGKQARSRNSFGNRPTTNRASCFDETDARCTVRHA